MYDMNNLKKLKKFGDLAPEAWKAFVAFDQAAMADGAAEQNQGADRAGGRHDHPVPLLH